MLIKAVAIVFIIISNSGAQNEESKIVTIAQGPVRGYKDSNSEVFQFFGIPYATAPTGEHRYKAPLAAPSWTEVFEAVQNDIVCPSPQFNYREDCLVANVFVPNSAETNLPVIVYIHGGAYFFGNGLSGSPRALAESQRVVAVTFNYRLGPHGFLCLGTEDVPGNAGLKDMVAALRWVKENIASFGGDPSEVTLAGFSAGASAADLLSLSKAANGLFNKLILDSAASLSSWSVQVDPIKTAQEHAQKLNFSNVENLTALKEFYKTASYDLLFSDFSTILNFNADFVFVPCIETDVGEERILDDSPINIIRSGDYTKLPALYGFANMEGRFRMNQFDLWAPLMNERFSDFLPQDLDFKDDTKAVAQTIKEFYFGNSPVGLYTLFDYIDYFSDSIFDYQILRNVKLHTEAGHESIYLYYYTFYNKFVGEPGVPDVLINFPGADHGAQTDAVLEMSTESSREETEEYKQMRIRMRELWINFVTTGTPVPSGSSFPTWPPVNSTSSPHMILGDVFVLGDVLNENRTLFWDGIYDRYYRSPMPPVFVESVDDPNHAGILFGSVLLNFVFVLGIFVINY